MNVNNNSFSSSFLVSSHICDCPKEVESIKNILFLERKKIEKLREEGAKIQKKKVTSEFAKFPIQVSLCFISPQSFLRKDYKMKA